MIVTVVQAAGGVGRRRDVGEVEVAVVVRLAVGVAQGLQVIRTTTLEKEELICNTLTNSRVRYILVFSPSSLCRIKARIIY